MDQACHVRVRRFVDWKTSTHNNTEDGMLVLSRRETERIRLGDSIVVTVVRVTGDKVRLGIDAPADVVVLREELEPHERTDQATTKSS
jgi:carbon storage regulator